MPNLQKMSTTEGQSAATPSETDLKRGTFRLGALARFIPLTRREERELGQEFAVIEQECETVRSDKTIAGLHRVIQEECGL